MSDPFIQLSEFIRSEMQTMHAPGMGVAIVRDGAILFAEGFGVRSISASDPITPDTLFAIASVTKSFTATALAQCVDRGELDWDTPVRDYLPGFKLYDQVATARATVRDLACHRTGVPRHDALWYNSLDSRRELLERLRYLEPSCDFRAQFQYSNLMYMALGCVLEEIGHTSWENIMHTRLLQPLGMTRSTVWEEPTRVDPNCATPHGVINETTHTMPAHFSAAVAPAGAIHSTLTDMCQWLLFNLRGNTALISEKNLHELHTPQIIEAGLQGVRMFTRYPEVSHASYGLGWTLFTYRGHPCLFHGGNTDGFSIAASFLPDDGMGLIAYANLHETLLPWLVTFNAYDHLLGLDELPWAQRFRDAKRSSVTPADVRKPNTSPSHALADYAGEYVHPGYGQLTIIPSGDSLRAIYNSLSLELVHIHYDIFDLRSERYGVTYRASFVTDLQGDLTSIAVPLEPAVKPIVFKRVTP